MKTMLLYIVVIGCISGVAVSDTMGSESSDDSKVLLSHLVDIGDLFNYSENYDGELVTIEGKYLGWSVPINAPMRTRSDWGIEDETGAIYVTGAWSGLDPMSDVGVNLIVIGIVHLIDGGPNYEGLGPILECKAITLIDAEDNTNN